MSELLREPFASIWMRGSGTGRRGCGVHVRPTELRQGVTHERRTRLHTYRPLRQGVQQSLRCGTVHSSPTTSRLRLSGTRTFPTLEQEWNVKLVSAWPYSTNITKGGHRGQNVLSLPVHVCSILTLPAYRAALWVIFQSPVAMPSVALSLNHSILLSVSRGRTPCRRTPPRRAPPGHPPI